MSWYVQDDNKDAKVLVKPDYCRNGEIRTDFLIVDKTEPGAPHNHESVDQYGNFTPHHDYDKK